MGFCKGEKTLCGCLTGKHFTIRCQSTEICRKCIQEENAKKTHMLLHSDRGCDKEETVVKDTEITKILKSKVLLVILYIRVQVSQVSVGSQVSEMSAVSFLVAL